MSFSTKVTAKPFSFKEVKTFSKDELNKVFNYVEDVSFQFNSDILPDDEKEAFLRYLMELSLWCNKNKSKIKGFSHQGLTLCVQAQKELNGMDDNLAEIITGVIEKTMSKWLEYFKSEKCFQDMQSSKISKEFEQGIVFEQALKSTKIEKLGTQKIFIYSGAADKCYQYGKTGAEYKQDVDTWLGKDTNTMSPAGVLDGSVQLDNGKTLKLFATANLNLSKQRVFNHFDTQSEVIFLTTAIFNPGYSSVHSVVDGGRKAQQHGTSFLDQFKGTDFNYDDKALFNILPIMSLINNIKDPESPTSKVTDLLKINPFVVGTDTYFLYHDFRNINQYENPEKTEKLLEYMVDFLDKITEKISKINAGFKLSQDTSTILNCVEKVTLGILNNFNQSNLSSPKGIPSNKILKKLSCSIERYNNIIGLMDKTDYSNSGMNSKLDDIQDLEDLKASFTRRNKRIKSKYVESKKEKSLIVSDNSLREVYSFIQEATDLTNNQKMILAVLVQSRQQNSKDNWLTPTAINEAADNFKNQNLFSRIFDVQFNAELSFYAGLTNHRKDDSHNFLKIISALEGVDNLNRKTDRETFMKDVIGLGQSTTYKSYVETAQDVEVEIEKRNALLEYLSHKNLKEAIEYHAKFNNLPFEEFGDTKGLSFLQGKLPSEVVQDYEEVVQDKLQDLVNKGYSLDFEKHLLEDTWKLINGGTDFKINKTTLAIYKHGNEYKKITARELSEISEYSWRYSNLERIDAKYSDVVNTSKFKTKSQLDIIKALGITKIKNTYSHGPDYDISLNEMNSGLVKLQKEYLLEQQSNKAKTKKKFKLK